jgi:hypothetical protein
MTQRLRRLKCNQTQLKSREAGPLWPQGWHLQTLAAVSHQAGVQLGCALHGHAYPPS